MITNAEYLEFLKSDARKVLLVELDYYDPIEEETGTFYLSDKGYDTKLSPTVQHRPYPDYVSKVPSTKRSLKARPARGELVVENIGGVRDEWLTRYKFDGRTVKMLYGHPDWLYEDFRPAFLGVVKSRQGGFNKLVFKLREPEDFLEQIIQSPLIAAGPNAGDYEPIVYGSCFNVQAVLIDGSTHVYQVSDIELNSIALVKDQGKGPVGHTPDLANGKFTLTSAATGNITVDLIGAKVGGSTLLKAGEIIDHIITTRTDLPAELYDSAAFDDLDTEIVWEHNLANIAGKNARQVIDKILFSVGAKLSRTVDGQITVVRWEEPNEVADVVIGKDDYKLGSLTPTRVELPWKSARLGYRKNHFVQESLDTTLTEDNRALLGREYSIVEDTNDVLTAHPLATEPALIETTLTDQADAEALLSQALAIHAVERFLFLISAYAFAFQYTIGMTAEFSNKRYGLSAGENFVIFDIDNAITSGRARISLWR